MTTGKTVHFLLVYNHAERVLVSQQHFENATAATSAYSELERLHAKDGDLEIVLVGADSIDTIRRTHASYFGDGAAVSDLLISA